MFSRQSALVTALAFISLIVLTPVASGTPVGSTGGIPNARGVYAGCYDERTGELRLVNTSRGCRQAFGSSVTVTVRAYAVCTV